MEERAKVNRFRQFNFKLNLCLLYLILFFLGLNISFQVFIVKVTIVELLFLVLFVSYLIYVIINKNKIELGKTGIILTLFTLSIIPAVLISQDKLTSIKEFSQIVYIVLFYIVIKNFNYKQSIWNEGYRYLFLGSLISSIIGIYQLVVGYGHESFKTLSGVIRIYSVFGQPNSFGAYISALLPLSFIFLLKEKNIHHMVYFILLDFTLIFTFSRGSWIATFITVILLSFIVFKKDFKKYIAYVLICLFLLSLFVPAYYICNMKKQDKVISYAVKKSTMKDYSINQRAHLYKTVFNILSHNPVFGVGPGAFPIAAEKYKAEGLKDTTNLVHNTLLQLWVEYGFLPLMIFLVFIYHLYREFFIIYQKDKDLLNLGIIGGITALLISSMGGWLFVSSIQELFIIYIILLIERTVDNDQNPFSEYYNK